MLTRMDHEEEPVADAEEEWGDVVGEAPPVDDYQLSTRPRVVGGEP